MNTGIIASRYAEALLKFVQETGESEAVYSQAGILEELFRKKPEFLRYIESPSLIPVSAKMDLISKILGNEGLAPSFRKFLLLVMRNGRADYLRYILYYFRMRYCKAAGISSARLTVSSPSPEIESKLKALFTQYTGTELDLDTKVDPSIIGGFIFEVSDRRIDASISSQLVELRRRFEEKNKRIV